MALLAKYGPIAIAVFKELEPEVKTLIAGIPEAVQPSAMSTKAVTGGTTIQAAMTAELIKDLPVLTDADVAKILAQVGNAIAEVATSSAMINVAAKTYLATDAAKATVTRLAQAAVIKDGIEASRISPDTWSQILLTGILLFNAGVGAQAIKV